LALEDRLASHVRRDHSPPPTCDEHQSSLDEFTAAKEDIVDFDDSEVTQSDPVRPLHCGRNYGEQ
jgi:hypothetical protein